MKYICDECENIINLMKTPSCILDIGEDSEWPEFCPFDKETEPDWKELENR
jgi:hypothetical protein